MALEAAEPKEGAVKAQRRHHRWPDATATGSRLRSCARRRVTSRSQVHCPWNLRFKRAGDSVHSGMGFDRRVLPELEVVCAASLVLVEVEVLAVGDECGEAQAAAEADRKSVV